MVRSRPRRPPIQEKDPLFVRWRDHDPSRIALWRGNGDFGQRAWRDHVGLPDSAAERPFGWRGELVARRFRSSRSGRDRTPYKQELESGSDHTKTICRILHRHSETHYPQASAVSCSLQPRADRACRRARTNQGQALRVAAKTRPALTGPARGGCAIWRSGRKNARGPGRTKEWEPIYTISKQIINLRHAPPASPCSVSILTAVHTKLSDRGLVDFRRVCDQMGILDRVDGYNTIVPC